MRKPAIRDFLLLLLLCCISIAATAGNGLVLSQGWLEDKQGTLNLQQVQEAGFTDFQGVFSRGYSSSVYWIRMQVRPSAHNKQIKLRIRPTFLDEVTLFEPDNTSTHSQWIAHVTGDTHSPSTGERGMNSISFVVEPAFPFTTYYLRVQTTSSMIFDIEALPLTQAAQKDALLAIWHFSYFSFILFTLAWGIVEFTRTRQRTELMFVLYQIVNFLYGFSVMGYIALLEPAAYPGLSDSVTSLFVLLLTLFGVFIHLSFIATYQPNRILFRIACILVVFPLAMPIVYLSGYKQFALQMNMFDVIQIGITMLILSLSLDKNNDLHSLRYIRNMYIFIFIITIFIALPLLGTVSTSEWKLQSALVHGVLVTGLVFHALRQRSKARDVLLETSRVELRQQQLFLEQQGRFIDMLTHEIKTPLTVATMNLDAMRIKNDAVERIRRALTAINHIVERTRISDLMEQQRLQPHLVTTDIVKTIHACINVSTHPDRLHATMPKACSMMTDPAVMSIIVSNLIDNALVHSPGNSPVALQFSPDSKDNVPYWCLRLRNQIGTGHIIDTERLFEKYYRNPLGHDKSGAGLGLYVSRKLAQLLDYELLFNTTDNTVEVTLWIPD